MFHTNSSSGNLFLNDKKNEIKENNNKETIINIENNIIKTNFPLQNEKNKNKISKIIKLKSSMKNIFTAMIFWKKFYKKNNTNQNNNNYNNNNKESKLEKLKKEDKKHFNREINIYAHQKFKNEFNNGLGFNYFL